MSDKSLFSEGIGDMPEPVIKKGLLNPVDRISEILYGVIIVMTFTCTFRVIKSDSTYVEHLFLGALCCNTAWGVVDAIMYLFTLMTGKQHGVTFLRFIHRSKDKDKVRHMITDSLPDFIATAMKPDEVEMLRQVALRVPEPTVIHRLKFKDYKSAAVIFLIVFLSSFPIAVPFLFIQDFHSALLTSNLVAILMMFLCGYSLGKYAGRNRFLMGIAMTLIGVALLALTISLGG